jgi:hypothetical protein
MKKFNLLILSVLSIYSFGCSSSEKIANDPYEPFTLSIKERLLRDSLDIKQVQFYVDQTLILSRALGTEKANVSSGVIKFENGQYINEIVIKKYTPGVCESYSSDRLHISFEKANNNIVFGLDNYYKSYFSLYGGNWSNGTAEIEYDGEIFRVRCKNCNTASDAKLVVKKNELNKVELKSRKVKGRRVGE